MPGGLACSTEAAQAAQGQAAQHRQHPEASTQRPAPTGHLQASTHLVVDARARLQLQHGLLRARGAVKGQRVPRLSLLLDRKAGGLQEGGRARAGGLRYLAVMCAAAGCSVCSAAQGRARLHSVCTCNALSAAAAPAPGSHWSGGRCPPPSCCCRRPPRRRPRWATHPPPPPPPPHPPHACGPRRCRGCRRPSAS